jgi:hypothetical protein
MFWVPGWAGGAGLYGPHVGGHLVLKIKLLF